MSKGLQALSAFFQQRIVEWDYTMLSSLSKIDKLHLRAMSPPRRKTPEAHPSSGDSVDLSASHHAEKRRLPLGKILATTLLATSALAGTAAAAQTPPIAETVTTEPTCCEAEVDLSKEEPSSKSEAMKFGVTGSFVNDNMPTFLRDIGNDNHKTPDGNFFDDDGWTAELRLEANWQNENSEYVLGGRLMMATERDSYNPSNLDFSGKRTDVAEFVLQRNERVQLSESATLDFGVGGGVQAVGQLGGESVQRWWHGTGLLGGRTGDALQGNQMSDSFRVMPLVTGGLQLNQQLAKHLSFTAGGQAMVPIGQGLGVVGLNAGLQGNLGPVRVEFGGKLDGSWSRADELEFMDVDGIRPGAYGSLELDTKKFGSLYTKVETGGFRDEPTLTVGLRIGLGGRARLSPFR
jgi:hypothetical protein